MGAGASRTSHHKHHSKRLPSPPDESLSPLKDTVQPKIPVQDQHFSHEAQTMEIKEQVDVARTSQTSTDKKASPNDTLETYKAKYPDQAEDLETMLERLQALKNFVDKDLNDPEDYAKLGKTIEGLFDTSVHTTNSALTQKEKQFTAPIDFTIDVGGVEQLKLFVQHCFEKFSHLIKEESDDKDEIEDFFKKFSHLIEEESDNEDEKEHCSKKFSYLTTDEEEESDDEEETDDYMHTCYNCLSNTLGAMHNLSDFHQGFCSACAGAGII